MAEKKEIVRIVTPKGDAIYPRLFTPDTKFNPDGDYKVTLAIPKDEALALIEQLKPFIKASHEAAKANCPASLKGVARDKWIESLVEKNPWEEMVDNETGQPTGKYKFNF